MQCVYTVCVMLRDGVRESVNTTQTIKVPSRQDRQRKGWSSQYRENICGCGREGGTGTEGNGHLERNTLATNLTALDMAHTQLSDILTQRRLEGDWWYARGSNYCYVNDVIIRAAIVAHSER